MVRREHKNHFWIYFNCKNKKIRGPGMQKNKQQILGKLA